MMAEQCPRCGSVALEGIVYVTVTVGNGRSVGHGVPALVCVRCSWRQALRDTLPVPDLARV